MIAIAEPLPIGSRVCKTVSWTSARLLRGTTTSLPYSQPGRHGYYVDVLWDGRPHPEPNHLRRIVHLR